MINAMVFDGSVRRLTDQESRHPVLWYPKGTQVNRFAFQSGNVMTADFDQFGVIP
jgi:hypothetical protein